MAVAIDPDDVECSAIRAPGPGGQDVNTVSNAVKAHFDIGASMLAAQAKEGGHRIRTQLYAQAPPAPVTA